MICSYNVFLHAVPSGDQILPPKKETKSAKLPSFVTAATTRNSLFAHCEEGSY